MTRLVLITGGARSGKSSYALELAESLSEQRLFIATCPKLDPEMEDRVMRHKQERQGRGWQTLECETELEQAFRTAVGGYDVVLLDCITLWVNNLLYVSEQRGEILTDGAVRECCQNWIKAVPDTLGTVICVTNEVGLGIVPDNALGRRYRDLVGTVNQVIGRAADQVTLVSCGIPVHIKDRPALS
ncbi:bifunctional adenosylcobinamide kinase/adenosylcobinamide-phosphate guanylyltransferase [Desulforhopalus singaporensis]|uniref:Adenosylcobinamide kinase n=1 Tax=Desulforhopalus singaporensis TaxID=91360 RepID=A0A1H0PIJ7_9BACT|nr:bifunctional adenosylcobinamide kinase/adenosylcobinamide-phosphate guanylyltransferase [Desulforhopalus singaporensis]SDP04488.1 adenosylcobinamide kinase /adenosylcobinamide-phosphate guanylyltransferase [Desulforhopalus singaporensis]